MSPLGRTLSSSFAPSALQEAFHWETTITNDINIHTYTIRVNLVDEEFLRNFSISQRSQNGQALGECAAQKGWGVQEGVSKPRPHPHCRNGGTRALRCCPEASRIVRYSSKPTSRTRDARRSARLGRSVTASASTSLSTRRRAAPMSFGAGGGDGEGAVDDNLLAEGGGLEPVAADQRREDEAGDLLAERVEEHRPAEQ